MRLHLARVFLPALLALPLPAYSHGDDAHDERPGTEQQVATPKGSGTSGEQNQSPATPVAKSTSTSSVSASDANTKDVLRPFGDLANDLSLSDFPTLHPVVVHAPVTLIPIAFLFSLLNLRSNHRMFIWLTLGFAVAGLLGGVVAAFPLHPHTTGLSEAAKVTLQKHDFFAYGTLWLTSAAVLVALFCVWRPTRIIKAGLCAVLLFSTLAVAITGHYGGTLAYVHGIGVQGQFLSTH